MGVMRFVNWIYSGFGRKGGWNYRSCGWGSRLVCRECLCMEWGFVDWVDSMSWEFSIVVM